MNSDTRKTMHIGELAADMHLNPKTIRYYEEIGLLPAPRRNAAGYRQYAAAERERLRFIAKAKALGFTLREIRELFALRDASRSPVRTSANFSTSNSRQLTSTWRGLRSCVPSSRHCAPKWPPRRARPRRSVVRSNSTSRPTPDSATHVSWRFIHPAW